uniref:Reverse transcriptase domain-containing protein n=1 Tax=Triticum urartu TaxID=4572 RepID=A0A8R7JVA2_TRIUA
MLVQGMARRLHALRNPVLLKLDISKAFDSVQLPFLIEVLHIMGFGTRWIGWICGLLATSSTRIMLNVPGKPIYNQCGLRQGNPLSPMLFILIMEPLQRLFHAASESGLLAPLAANGLRNRL